MANNIVVIDEFQWRNSDIARLLPQTGCKSVAGHRIRRWPGQTRITLNQILGQKGFLPLEALAVQAATTPPNALEYIQIHPWICPVAVFYKYLTVVNWNR
jgi:hypothetical protein